MRFCGMVGEEIVEALIRRDVDVSLESFDVDSTLAHAAIFGSDEGFRLVLDAVPDHAIRLAREWGTVLRLLLMQVCIVDQIEDVQRYCARWLALLSRVGRGFDLVEALDQAAFVLESPEIRPDSRNASLTFTATAVDVPLEICASTRAINFTRRFMFGVYGLVFDSFAEEAIAPNVAACVKDVMHAALTVYAQYRRGAGELLATATILLPDLVFIVATYLV